MAAWAPIGDTSQPYYPNMNDALSPTAPTLSLLEVPDNGIMVDYVSVEEMQDIFAANWDGTPLEFLNGQTLNVRHPSDPRNASWGPVVYATGSATNKFPAAIWKDKNNGSQVTFNLSSAQLAARTVRIGISAAYANARPQITINGWTSAVPTASSQPDSRSLTIGTYRGNNTLFTYSVPASAFVAGSNTLTINAASGSGSSAFLSAGFAVDCVDLY